MTLSNNNIEHRDNQPVAPIELQKGQSSQNTPVAAAAVLQSIQTAYQQLVELQQEHSPQKAHSAASAVTQAIQTAYNLLKKDDLNSGSQQNTDSSGGGADTIIAEAEMKNRAHQGGSSNSGKEHLSTNQDQLKPGMSPAGQPTANAAATPNPTPPPQPAVPDPMANGNYMAAFFEAMMNAQSADQGSQVNDSVLAMKMGNIEQAVVATWFDPVNGIYSKAVQKLQNCDQTNNAQMQIDAQLATAAQTAGNTAQNYFDNLSSTAQTQAGQDATNLQALLQIIGGLGSLQSFISQLISR